MGPPSSLFSGKPIVGRQPSRKANVRYYLFRDKYSSGGGPLPASGMAHCMSGPFNICLERWKSRMGIPLMMHVCFMHFDKTPFQNPGIASVVQNDGSPEGHNIDGEKPHAQKCPLLRNVLDSCTSEAVERQIVDISTASSCIGAATTSHHDGSAKRCNARLQSSVWTFPTCHVTHTNKSWAG